MKKINIILSFSLVFLLLLMGCVDTQLQLKEFKSEDGGFSVLMPGTPKLETQTANTAAGPLDIKMYGLEKNGIGYSVGYIVYPEEAVAEQTPEQTLDGARDGAVANVFGTLTLEKIISVGGYPAREITIAVEDGGVRARIILVNNTMYIVTVAATKDKIVQPHIKDVLESFKLL